MVTQLTEKKLGVILFNLNNDKVNKALEQLKPLLKKDVLDKVIKNLEDAPIPQSYWY